MRSRLRPLRRWVWIALPFSMAAMAGAAGCPDDTAAGGNGVPSDAASTTHPPDLRAEDGAIIPVAPDGAIAVVDPTLIDGSAVEADGSGDAMDSGRTSGLDPAFQHFDINHVLSTGQSNSVANSSRPILSTAQPYDNKMFDVGVITSYYCDGDGCKAFEVPTSLVPLVEGDVFFGNVETMSAGMANAVTKVARENLLAGQPPGRTSHDVMVSLHGRSGRTYWCLRKGSCNWLGPAYHNPTPFDDGMRQVQYAKDLAAAAGKTYVVRAVTAIHGESDHNAYVNGRPEFPLDGTDGTPGKIRDYTDALVEWQQDYENGVKAITGQTIPVPLLISQVSGWNSSVAASPVVNMQYAAHVRAPGKVVLVTAAYPFPFQTDCLHFTAASQRRVGEYFAKAYRRVVIEGLPWEPLRPRDISRVGNVITVRYFVPKPPIVFDATLVSQSPNQGFTFVDGSGAAPTIAQVRIASPDTIEITLSADPTGAGRKLRYAQNQNPSTCVGPFLGARGNVRDSDDLPSMYVADPKLDADPFTGEARYKAPLYNWGVQFELDVP